MEQPVATPRDFWFDEATDRAMEAEHPFVWRTMLETVDVDLAGTRVLDVGCSMGGFLRLLADEAGIAEGFGYDPAVRPVALANERADGRPLTYAVADRVPEGWGGFDVAFSHEVLFTLHDLGAHARDVWAALRPGGVYFAVMGTHDRNPTMAAWHADVQERLGLPAVYSLEQVVEAFESVGFEVQVGRLRVRFVPTGFVGDADLGDVLDYYDRHKVMFRFGRPPEPRR